MKTELKTLQETLRLSENGPYEIFSTANLISQEYHCQIFVFGGEDNNSKLKHLIPPDVDDRLQPIYLYEPLSNSDLGHVIFIKNLQSYFKANKRVCFQCFKTFKCYRYLHRCLRFKDNI